MQRFADVERCLAQGRNAIARGEDGNTPLHYAAAGNVSHAVVELLLDHHADPAATGKDGAIPLHATAVNDNGYIFIELLLGRGIDLESRDEYGRTAAPRGEDQSQP